MITIEQLALVTGGTDPSEAGDSYLGTFLSDRVLPQLSPAQKCQFLGKHGANLQAAGYARDAEIIRRREQKCWSWVNRPASGTGG